MVKLTRVAMWLGFALSTATAKADLTPLYIYDFTFKTDTRTHQVVFADPQIFNYGGGPVGFSPEYGTTVLKGSMDWALWRPDPYDSWIMSGIAFAGGYINFFADPPDEWRFYPTRSLRQPYSTPILWWTIDMAGVPYQSGTGTLRIFEVPESTPTLVLLLGAIVALMMFKRREVSREREPS